MYTNILFPSQTFSSSSTINIFEKAKYYENNILEKQYYPYQYDGWDSRKFYGLKDKYNNIIYPKQSALIEYYNNNGNNHKNINFVVDAFKDFKQYQDDLQKTNKTNNNSIFTKLNVRRSTESVPDLYLKELGRLYEIFTNTFLTDTVKKEIVDIFSFIKYFLKFVNIISTTTSLNRSTFIVSKFAPPTINGLTISFEDIEYDANYERKANTYIANPQFDHFIITASKFGFFVDRNYPYSIVADIESPIMKSYARKRGYSSTQNIFDNCYFKAYKADLDSLKNVVLGFWNSYAFYNRSQIINNNSSKTQKIYYNQLTLESFEKLFNVNWQLRLYLYSRILESKVKINQNKFENLYNECIKINKFIDTDNSLLFINQKLLEIKKFDESDKTFLTNEDLRIKLISESIDPLPVEGINF